VTNLEKISNPALTNIYLGAGSEEKKESSKKLRPGENKFNGVFKVDFDTHSSLLKEDNFLS
jgi:hypothetical protein